LSGSASSLDTYTSTLTRFFSLCDKLPDAVSRTDVLHFMNSPSTSKRNPGVTVSASAKCQRLCVLRSFYTFASSWQAGDEMLFQKANPTTGIVYPKREVHPHALSLDEFQQLLAVIPTTTAKGLRDKALFLLYWWLGRRRSELYRLQFQDIQATIIVDADGTRRSGYTYTYTGKGKARQPIIKEFPLPCWTILHTYLERSGRLQTIHPQDFLFVSSHPGQGRKDGLTNVPLNHHYVNTLFRAYAKQAGLDRKYSLHSLRHSSARERYLAGSNVRDIQQLLDHSNIGVTDLYLRTLAGISDPGSVLLFQKFSHLGKL
jgi:integrase/recombinase XerD